MPLQDAEASAQELERAVSDLGLNEAADLKPLVTQLQSDGYQVGLQHGYVWIPKEEWGSCQRAATRELQIVYGGDQQEAVC